MHSLGSLAKWMFLLLAIATFVASHQPIGSFLDGISFLPHEGEVEVGDLPANDTLSMATCKFYNGSHLVLRQVNPNTPAWALPYAVRGRQTFITFNSTERSYLMDMIGNMWILAIAAIEIMGTPEARIYSSSFLRYLGPDEWEDVRNGFQALLGCERPVNSPDELSYMRTYWDTSAAALAEIPGTDQSHSCNSITSYGFGFTTDDPWFPKYCYWLVICPRALAYRTGLRPFDCNLLQSRRMSSNLLSGGQMMLHEMMHWQYISEKAMHTGVALGDAGIKDWNTDSRDPNAIPPNGYGPYNAMLVNKLRRRGSQNPDNYTWFAYESYLLQDKPGQCGGSAMNPPLTGFGIPIPPW